MATHLELANRLEVMTLHGLSEAENIVLRQAAVLLRHEPSVEEVMERIRAMDYLAHYEEPEYERLYAAIKDLFLSRGRE